MKSILFNADATQLQIAAVRRALTTAGAAIVYTLEGDRTVMLVSDPADEFQLVVYRTMPGVEAVMQQEEKNLHVSRDRPTIDLTSGIDGMTIIAGPCGIESEEQVAIVFEHLAKEGLRFVRGGAYKPRTSPHDFQGSRRPGLEMASTIARDYGLQLVSEAVDPRDIDLMAQYVSVLQIGTRSMQNFALLKEAGASGLPILLKRGMSATVEEWIGAAEHALVAGAATVIFCERGIRTFESITRNTLDVLGAAALKEKTKLPVIIDPSHAAGRRSLVIQGALAGVAAGLDGMLVEVHHDPASARSDAAQALTLDDFSRLMELARNVRAAVHDEVRS
ncbi:MAG: bifunctional 3-deoxy-7-phosphoheptulonate synthase/chorismate mutase [bacterium]|nr:bifunctional 3-deoxy-7-phosphoheptulonate synthase/chorismate mutase [Candidatus Kapabacteria bacterium]